MLVVVLGATGCGKPAPLPLATPAPTRAWVRLDTLLTNHPLSRTLPEVAQNRPFTLAHSASVLPLLPSPLTESAGWAEAQKRRLLGRTSLAEADSKGIQEFALSLQRRQTKFLEVSQAQFEAKERIQTTGKALEDRREAQRSVAERVESLRDDLALAQTQYQISRALASPANDTLLTPDDPPRVQAEVARLKEANLRAEIRVDTQTGVRRAKVLWKDGLPPRNPRVLYAASRDVLKVLCDALEAQVGKAEEEAEAKRLQSAQDRDAEIRLRVTQYVEGLRSRDENFVLKLDQEESLGRILLAEELPTRRAASGQYHTPPRITRRGTPADTIRPLKQTTVEKQRSALEAEVRAVVLDVARRHGIQVSFSPSPGVPDRTTEFANWIRVSL